MDFSGLAGALGAGFQGYAKDKEDELRRQALAAQLQGQDFDRTMRLRENDYAPVGDVQTALRQAAQGASAAPVTGAVPGAAAGFAPDASDMVQRLMAANQAKNLQTSLAGQFTVPGQKQAWAPLPYDETKVGLQQRKSLAVDAARAAAESSRQQSQSERAAQATQAKETRTQQRAAQTLKAEFPKDPLNAQPFDPVNPADYVAALAHQRDMQKSTAAAQIAADRMAQQEKLQNQRLQAQDKANKDQSQMEFSYMTAKPSIDALRDWFSQDRNPSAVASAASHLPFVGNYFTGQFDKDFQLAQQHARTVAQQWAEMQPKMRFQPNTVALVEQQIMPEVGDTPAKRKAKADLLDTYERSMKRRAGIVDSADPFSDVPKGP